MRADPDIQRQALGNLSDIDRQILRLVAQGRSSKEIGKEMGRSPLTIDSRLKEVCFRVGADNRVQAASMLLIEETMTPPNIGGSQDAGIESGLREGPAGLEGYERLHASTGASHAGDRTRRKPGGLRSLLFGTGVEDETPIRRLIRIIWAVLLVAVGLALVFFFLASALEAFQGVILGIGS